MKQPTLVCIEHEDGYIAFYEEFAGFIVQVDNLEDIPKELATSLEVYTRYLIRKGKFINKKY